MFGSNLKYGQEDISCILQNTFASNLKTIFDFLCLQQQINVLKMATLHITLDKQVYLAGDTVTGQVLLAVPANINGSQGVSLHFSAFESLKSVQPRQLQASSNIPLDQVYHTDKIQVSECASEQNSNSGLRPKYIRTANNNFYEVKFSEQRNEFAKATVKLMENGKIPSGQYSFPFSFKTFEDWPGSFKFDSPEKKAQISYRLTASVDPVSPHFDFHTSREVIILGHQLPKKGDFSNEVTSFFCFGKGRSSYSLAWAQEMASPNTPAKILISIDNSQCTADIKRISLSLKSSLSLGQGGTDKIERVLYSREINGVRAGEKCIDDKAISETFDLSKLTNLPSQTKGKYIASSISLSVTFNYDTLFYSANASNIPLKLASSPDKVKTPSSFEKDFKPKSMPAVALALQSTFKNQTISENFASSQKFQLH